MTKPKARTQSADDLRGVSQLAVDATTGITDLVEAMHRNIARIPGLTPSLEDGRTNGITGFVYRSVRGVTQVVGGGIDAALALASPLLGNFTDVPARDAVQSALNGVLGDHLVASKNPLAITMQFRQHGEALKLTKDALTSAIPNATGKLVVLIHGLCMNDLQWNATRDDGTRHDHGALLQTDLGYTAVYLRYNTGLHVADNGKALASALDALIAAWPVPVKELAIVAHSMGGLVTRSACHSAEKNAQPWRSSLKKIVFLGTPHQGAPLERGGHWIDVILGAAPYASPFAKLGKVRSTGITDLRYGSVVDEAETAHAVLPLPTKVKCFAIAATTGKQNGDLQDRLLGDGLVPLASALGEHEDPKLALKFPAASKTTLYATNHMQLLSAAPAYEALKTFLSA
jgi:pimeloyl-ACP methyl ester carboxylesterase